MGFHFFLSPLTTLQEKIAIEIKGSLTFLKDLFDEKIIVNETNIY